MSPLADAVAWAGRWLSSVYALGLPIEPERYVIGPELVRRLVPGRVPRTGVLAIESAGELRLGLYVDPRDRADTGAIVEETSHLLCLAWHASRDLPVSRLALELQAEVDRFLVARACRRNPLSHFARFRWAEGLDAAARSRYESAHHHGQRYCRKLLRRFPRREHGAALLAELRGFYRASPAAKLRRAASPT